MRERLNGCTTLPAMNQEPLRFKNGRWLAVAIVAAVIWCGCVIRAGFLDRERRAMVQWEPGEPMPIADDFPPLWIAIPGLAVFAALAAGFVAAPVLLLTDACRRSRLANGER